MRAQDRLGNRGVARLLSSVGISRKAIVSEPGDADELEADRIAESVLGMREFAPPIVPEARPESQIGRYIHLGDEGDVEHPARRRGDPPSYAESLELSEHAAPEFELDLDMNVPETVPDADTTRSEDEIDAWETAHLLYTPVIEFECESTTLGDGRSASFVRRIAFRMDDSRYTFRIARERAEAARDAAMSDWVPGVILDRVRTHGLEHFARYERVVREMRTEIYYALLALPRASRPIAVERAELERYVEDLGRYLHARLAHALWRDMCDWETEDYPRLLRGLYSVSRRGPRVDCGAEPAVPARPLPPVPIRAASREPARIDRAGDGALVASGLDELADRVDRARSEGTPLPHASAQLFEPRFGHDFSGVRIHSGSESAALAQSLGARALTMGRDIFFDRGEFQPSSHEGRKLLAHELAHTVQRRGDGDPKIRRRMRAVLIDRRERITGGAGYDIALDEHGREIGSRLVGDRIVDRIRSMIVAVAQARAAAARDPASAFCLTMLGMNEANAIHALDDGYIVSRGTSVPPFISIDPTPLIGEEAAAPLLRTGICSLPAGTGNSWFYRDVVRVIEDPRTAFVTVDTASGFDLRQDRRREGVRGHSAGFTFPLGSEERPTGAVTIVAGVELDNASADGDAEFREQFEMAETEATAHEIVHIIRLFTGAPWRDADPEVARTLRLVRRLAGTETARREGDLPLAADPHADLRWPAR